MKTIEKFSIGLLVMLATLITIPAFAQSRGDDTFGVPRTLTLGQAVLSVATGVITNGPYDIRIFDGIGKVDITTTTNTSGTGAAMTIQLLGSVDQTNFTYVPVSISTNYTVTYTNYYYSTNGLTSLQTYELPYVPTTPNAALAGWATPYGAYSSAQLMTNLAPVNANIGTGTKTAVTTLGFSVGDAPRYLYIVYSTSGTLTNLTASAVLTAYTHSGQVF